MSALLEVRGLEVAPTAAPETRVVDGLDLSLGAGEALALVGESGSGKTSALLALLDLLPPGLVRAGGSLAFEGRDLGRLDPGVRRRMLGSEIGVVFQEPTRALNPLLPVGEQVAEGLRHHLGLSRAAARTRAIELLEEVGIESAAERARDYPHQLSGGMNQRVVIAMAVACGPKLLVADEPTTALDVTVQREVLGLFDRLRRDRGMAVLFVTHDLALVPGRFDRVAVLYAGRIAEEGPVPQVFDAPRHPYTSALFACQPQRARPGVPLPEVGGAVPTPGERPGGCAFHPRCPAMVERCAAERPELTPEEARRYACFRPEGVAAPAGGTS